MKSKKIWVFGTMGSGKTTFAKKLSEKLKIKHYGLDDVYYVKQFTKKRSKESRKKLLDKITDKKEWIIEGVHNEWTEFAIKKADLLIWLDIHPIKIVKNLIKRFIHAKIKKTEKGDFKMQWSSIKYGVNYRKGEKKYIFHKKMVDEHKGKHIIIKNNKEMREFLKNI